MGLFNIKKTLQKNIFLAKDKLGLSFFQKPQQYMISFRVIVRNLTLHKNSIKVILPLPLETFIQTVRGNFIFFPREPEIFCESTFLNKYVIWRATLSTAQQMVFGYDVDLNIKPQEYHFSNTLNLKYTPQQQDSLSNHLRSCFYIKSDDPRVKEIYNNIKKHQQEHPFQILKRLNAYVIERLRYGKPIEGLYTSMDALDMGVVDCGGFNTLLAALARCAGIPTRLVMGFWVGYPAFVVPGFWLIDPKNNMHAWLECMMPDGSWVGADPAVEQLVNNAKAFQSGRLGFLGSDRVAVSTGCELVLDIGDGEFYSTDILQNPIVISEYGRKSFEKKISFESIRL